MFQNYMYTILSTMLKSFSAAHTFLTLYYNNLKKPDLTCDLRSNTTERGIKMCPV